MSFNLHTVKNAAITAAATLAVIWVVRRTAIGQKVTDTALKG